MTRVARVRHGRQRSAKPAWVAYDVAAGSDRQYAGGDGDAAVSEDPRRQDRLAQRKRNGEATEQLEQIVSRAPAEAYAAGRSEEATSELQSLMRISYAGLRLKK